MTKAYIALGSNIGDRQKHIGLGISWLEKIGRITPSPLIVETNDESGLGPPYLNTVVELDTPIPDPKRLLEECLRIELACGRERPDAPNAPRALDLDLIIVDGWIGNLEWDTPDDLLCLGPLLTLTLPHPRAGQRAFVQEPLKALVQ